MTDFVISAQGRGMGSIEDDSLLLQPPLAAAAAAAAEELRKAHPFQISSALDIEEAKSAQPAEPGDTCQQEQPPKDLADHPALQAEYGCAAAPSPRGLRVLRPTISTIPTPFQRATTNVLREAQEQVHRHILHYQGADDDEPEAAQPAPTGRRVSFSTGAASAGDSTQFEAQESPRSAHQMWHDAVRRISKIHSVSKQFHTLRDMRSSLEIPRESVKVVSVLGKGAFAIVEQCVYQQQGGRPQLVAVKRLRPELTRNKEDLRDLVQEVALLRKLQHRHVIDFLGFGYWDFSTTSTTRQGSLFIVEELVDGGNLKTVVARQMHDARCRHYRATDALRWLSQVADGLAYLHRSQPQVIHRDLKLENILLKGNDMTTSEAKIGDFGLCALVRRTTAYTHMQQQLHGAMVRPARARRNSATDMEAVWAEAAARRNSSTGPGAHHPPGAKQHQHHQQQQQQQRKGNTLGQDLEVASGYEQLSGRTGTLMYMAPEVYRQEPYSEKADVFSWAIIAYELLHRYMMIKATDGSFEECQAYARRVAYGFRPPINSHLPKELGRLISLCWHQDPGKRPSMAGVVQHLGVLAASLDLEAFDRDLLGHTYTAQLAQELAPRQAKRAPDPACCTIC